MSQAAPLLQHSFHAAILHPDEASILLLEDGQGWRLPQLEPEVPFFPQVAQINEAMRIRCGMETVVLRCLDYRTNRGAGRDGGRVDALFSLEAQAASRLPHGGRWVGLQELCHLRLTMPEQREVLEHVLKEDADGGIPALRPPWARRGWFKEAERWVQKALSRAGRKATGPLKQVKQWSITSLSRVPTENGYVYFKAVPPLFAREPSITQALAELFPDAVPRPLAIDRAKGWMLLDDFGGQTLQEYNPARWPEVMRRFAELQVASVRHCQALLAAGCMDRRLDRLEEGFVTLLTRAEELQDLTDEERERLSALAPQLRAMIGRLKSYAVPETLLHGDFHSNNIALAGDRVIFFDWTDGAIGHPFFDLIAFVHFHDAKALTPERWKEMLGAYLQPWTAFEPASRLHEAVPLALTLSLLHHAASYDAIRASQEEGARWELAGTTAYLLKTLLEKVSSRDA